VTRPRFSDETDTLIVKSVALAFALAMPVVLGVSPKIFGDGDVSWHIAAGNWILVNGRVPTADPFSFTMAGRPWVAFEWLSEVIYASAFKAAGYRGLSAVVVLALLGLHAVAFRFLAARVKPLALVCALVAMDVVLASFLFARPHVLVWPLLALWTAALLHYRDRGQKPPLALALLMVLWVNLHGSFVLGFAVVAAIALDAMIGSRWDRALLTGWLAFGLAALAAALFNANGATGVFHPFHVMQLENLAFIQEWEPSSPSTTPAFFAVLLLVLGFALRTGVRLALGETLLLLFMLLLALSQARHQSWLAIVAALILAPRLAPAGDGGREPFFAQRWMRQTGVVIAIPALALLAVRMAWSAPRPERADNPQELLAHVPASLRGQSVFNEYSFGGPLILAGIRPYIDGRSEMYGDRFMANYFAIQSGDMRRFDRAVGQYGIAWTLLRPNSRMVQLLDGSPEWRRIYANEAGVIHVRVEGSREQ
jgi:hypothetical protein